MSGACNNFRALLEQQLLGTAPSETAVGSGVPSGLTELSWHAHLLSCADCRCLLEAEEALEMVLASLPEPHLPEALARRVIERLRSSRDLDRAGALEHLLELDALPDASSVTGDLAAGILSGLEAERARLRSGRDEMLDRLLDMDRAPAIPHLLARRTLSGLAPARDASRRVARPSGRVPSLLRSTWVGVLLAASIAFIAFFGWAWNRSRSGRIAPDGGGAVEISGLERSGQAGEDAPPTDELLAALDVLEGWDLVEYLGETAALVAAFETADELLLEFSDEQPSEPGERPGPLDNPLQQGREERDEG